MNDLSLAAKRFMDLSTAGLGLLVLGPLMLLLAAVIRARLGPPVFFRQVRPGRNGVPFRLWKFRTMTNERDSTGSLKPDEERGTTLGRWLRRWSLDELPQLINVLTGEMSLVGPRPLLMRYLPRYNPEQARRMLAKPGITGWAQVNGRNGLAWDRRLELDTWYADHWSLRLDFKIIALTALAVLRSEGVKPGAGEELDEFWGEGVIPDDGPRAKPVEEDETSLDGRWKQ